MNKLRYPAKMKSIADWMSSKAKLLSKNAIVVELQYSRLTQFVLINLSSKAPRREFGLSQPSEPH